MPNNNNGNRRRARILPNLDTHYRNLMNQVNRSLAEDSANLQQRISDLEIHLGDEHQMRWHSMQVSAPSTNYTIRLTESDYGIDEEDPFYFTSDTHIGSVEQPMTTDNKENIVTNEFIESYFKSDDWLSRLSKKFEACLYDGFIFNSKPEERAEAMLRAPRNISITSVLNIALTSKNFADKTFDMAFLRQELTKFMERNDFIIISQPEALAQRLNGHYFNKYYFVNAAVKYTRGRDSQPVMASIPTDYMQVCPCCVKPQLSRDWIDSSRSLFQLCGTAFNRFFAASSSVQIPLDIAPGFVWARDQMGRHVCHSCSKDESKQWFQCSSCGRYEQKEFSSNLPVPNYEDYTYCAACFENQMRDHMFVTNALEFQQASLEQPSRMRYVGCEFECYVQPKALPKFDKRFVHQVKHDGSLQTQGKGIGIEVVTQPLLTWREEGIKAICKELEKANVTVDQTCGGHIHVDSTGINLNRSNMMRFRNLFRIYESAFFAVCSKDRLNNSRYCAPVSLDSQSGPQDNRYVSLNLCSLASHNTIEFRCFDGSADADEWLARIAFAEGFVNFAKDTLNNMIETTEMGVLSPLSKDSGLDNWNNLIDGYYNRSNVMKDLITKNGPALINLAGCRFKLKPHVISSLVKQHEKSWKL